MSLQLLLSWSNFNAGRNFKHKWHSYCLSPIPSGQKRINGTTWVYSLRLSVVERAWASTLGVGEEEEEKKNHQRITLSEACDDCLKRQLYNIDGQVQGTNPTNPPPTPPPKKIILHLLLFVGMIRRSIPAPWAPSAAQTGWPPASWSTPASPAGSWSHFVPPPHHCSPGTWHASVGTNPGCAPGGSSSKALTHF